MMIFAWLAFGFFVYYLFESRESVSYSRGHKSHEEILRERFANGEIDETEYIHLKEMLKA